MMRSGGRLLVECLLALGATKSFGVPGESYLAVLDALHDTQGRLDFVLCRNEGGAAFMASAYGKLTDAVLEIAVPPEALTPHQTLSQMRAAALASQKATA
jgi:thiamine pyrophosphate-dependent acetolactate synthase large subunit-like protein